MNAPRASARVVLILLSLCVLFGPRSWAQQEAPSRIVAAYDFHAGRATPDRSVVTSAGTQRACDAVEAYVWSVLPPEVKDLVSRLELFSVSDPRPDDSDGTATEAPDGTSWTLALDEGEGESAVLGTRRSDRITFDELIAHEVAHVLSLNERQRADGGSPGAFADEEGAFSDSSYLNRFYQQFWKGRYETSADGGKGSGRASARFAEHPQAFVSEYAATDPSEDFAESFARFVLDLRPFSRSETAEKLLFFYAWPELAADRRTMRQRMASIR